ncbi:MAG: outer membrane beta-barrel protein [Prevotella sp.]|nr:outer membrane beta-barrel protein [Prevotella sp.]
MNRSEGKKARLVRVLLVLVAYHLSLVASWAQDEPEYRLEIGGGIGTVTYLGDFNVNLLKGMQPWGTAMVKYKINPRMAVGATLGYGRIKGSSSRETTWYPQGQYEFGTKMVDGGFRFEYNFWPYGTGREYRGAQRLTPYIAPGLGITYHGGPVKGVAVNLPLGAGIKYKIGDRLNLAAEWRMHFTLSDKLDGMTDPYGIKSSGIFKNTDCFSILQMILTYDLWAKCKTCHNDRD